MADDMFSRWRAAAGRVEAALEAHEAALRAADDRLARGAGRGFRARWWDLGRESGWLLRNYWLPLGRAEPDALAVLNRCWPPPTAPRVVHDAELVRALIAAVRAVLDAIERPAAAAPAPAPPREAPARAKRPGYPRLLLDFMAGRPSARFDEIAAALGCEPSGIPMIKGRANQALRLRDDPRELVQDGVTIRWRDAGPGASNNTNK